MGMGLCVALLLLEFNSCYLLTTSNSLNSRYETLCYPLEYVLGMRLCVARLECVLVH